MTIGTRAGLAALVLALPLGAQAPMPFEVRAGNVYRGAFTPDGSEFYFFTRVSASDEDYRIFVSKRGHDRWTPPVRVLLGGDFSDLYPSISPDGRRMVFASYRRSPGDTSTTPDATLWYVDRVGDEWGQPVPMTRASQLGFYNSGPTFESDGSIAFTAGRPNVTRWNGHEYGEPEPDDRVRQWATVLLSSDQFMWGATGTATPAGDAMILTVSPVDSATGRRLPADLWVSRRTGDRWTEPRPLGAGVNSERNENFPFFSADGRELYFVRDFARFYHVPLAAAIGDSAAPAARGVVSVPLMYADARVYVPVHVKGDSVRWYILDTGAQPTMLDVATARRIGVDVADAGVTMGAGAGSMRQGRTHAIELRVGSVPLGPLDATVAPIDSTLAPYTGLAAPGVIGSRFFREHVVTLDFSWPVMHVYDGSTYRADSGGIVVPFELRGDIPVIAGRLTTPRGDVLPMRLVVDLGAKATLLVSEPFIARHHLADAFARTVEGPLGAGVGGETRYGFVRAPRLALDGVVADSIVVGLSVGGTLRSDWYDGLLGAEFLRRYRVTFDYAHRRMILAPRDPVVPPAEYDMSGMFLVAGRTDHHRFVVHELVAAGPAADAGVERGDVVVAIDGQPASAWSLSALRNVLRSRDGRVVRLELDRDGARVECAVRLRRQI